jgi:CDP-diacylglycerol--serine O-phosphatidyltransferase
MIDGPLARRKKNRSEAEKEFGIQLDSLCDVMSFGFVPALILYRFWNDFLPKYLIFAVIPMFILIMATVIRLANFNADKALAKNKPKNREYYTGMPSPAISFFLPIAYSVATAMPSKKLSVTVFTGVYILVAGLFVSKIRVPKPGTIGKITCILIIVIGAVVMVI